jgi:tetratricopeptide (TPR) repeat protein
VKEHWTEARYAMETAWSHFESGSADPDLRAWLALHSSSLCKDERDFDEAINYAADAERISREIGNAHQFVAALIQRGIAHMNAGAWEVAADEFRRAVRHSRGQADPSLRLAAHHNLVLSCLGMRRSDIALSTYLESREVRMKLRGNSRTASQEGMLLRHLGHLHAAEGPLLQARYGFLSRGLAYEAVYTSRELAIVYAMLGQRNKLKELVEKTAASFAGMRVEAPVLDCLTELRALDNG